MRQHYPEVEAVGGQVLAIGFAAPERLRELAEDVQVPFPILRDPEYRAYRAFGLEKGSRWAIYGPRTLWAYLTLLLRGRRFSRTTGDPYQLGGDFVVDGGGVVRLAYRGRDPADRPPVSRLLEALRSAAHPSSP